MPARKSIDIDVERRAREQRPAPPAIELRHFRYFLAVHEELHFGRAAARLHIAQPPLSQAVRKLEAELGVQLLERTSRVVTSTAAGDAFAAEARKVVMAVDVAIAAGRRATDERSAFRIGCSPYLPIELLLEFLGALDVRLPDLHTEVTHTMASDQVARLRTGELDIGIIPNAGVWDEVELEPIFAGQPLAAFVPADHPLARKKRVTPVDVRNETLVLFPRSANPALHDRILALLYEHGYRFRGVHEIGGSSSRDFVLAVLGGIGVSVSFYSHKEVSEAGGTVTRLPLDPAVPGPELALAWRAEPLREARPVIDVVREVARKLRSQAD